MKVLVLFAATFSVASAGSVSHSLKAKVASGGIHEAILELPSVMSQVESSSLLTSLKGDAKVNALVTMLKDLASASQAKYMSKIKSVKGIEAEQFWAANIIHLKGIDKEALEILGELEGDFEIREPHTVSIEPVGRVEEINVTVSQSPQWGVAQIRAPAAWSVTLGQNIVIGVIDTGANVDHEALRNNFAGAWSDPYYSSATPTDTHGHGSHCLGVALGTQNGIGVAPGARWVACRGLNNQGSGGEAQLTHCAQFMITANPKPNIISNSWGGGSEQPWFNNQITAWRLAGIIPLFANGNGGGCRSCNSPADQPNVISVGATGINDAVSSFSARGPTTSGLLCPILSAPGQNIISAGTGSNNYVTMSGTSISTPHVAGAVALVLSDNPTWDYDQVLNRLQESAAHPTLTAGDRNCGLPIPGQDFPNHAFGWGRIDVGAAVGA